MTDLTGPQKAYNVAQYDLFQLAAYGHCTYTNGEMLTDEGKRKQSDYNDRIRAACQQLEATLLRLVAEKAESFRGGWGIPAAWLRSLADDPAAVSLLAVHPDELPDDAPAVVVAPPTDRADLRARIVAEVQRLHDTGGVYALDAGEPERIAAAVLAVLGEQTDRAAEWHAAADALEAYIDRYRSPSIANWTGAAAFLRDRAVEAHGTGTQQPPAPQRAYPDCERCGDTGVDPERDGAEPCPECQQPNVPAPVAQQQPDAEAPTEEQIVRDHVTALHLIGEQLATIESWMWQRLFEVREAAAQPAPVAQQPAALRAELKPWQLLADAPAEPLPQTERVIGGRRLATTEQQAAAADGEETPVHACPEPGDNGISRCCGRPPCEFVGERLTRDPDKVTCRGPRP